MPSIRFLLRLSLMYESGNDHISVFLSLSVMPNSAGTERTFSDFKIEKKRLRSQLTLGMLKMSNILISLEMTTQGSRALI